MHFGTWIHTLLRGRRVGVDDFGNRYYIDRGKPRRGRTPRRWVIFHGLPEASAVPAEWHNWLHYVTDDLPPAAPRLPWMKPHLPNLTGTPGAYFPPGHQFRGGHRRPATGDYQAWTPDL